jgi:formate/nitrite transporter
MDYVNPQEAIAEALEAAEKKVRLSVRQMLMRGFLSGAFLGYATSLVMVILAQGLPPIVGAVAFPVGFVMLVLLGLELATGNFALLPQALAAGRVSVIAVARNWWWVYIGNLAGSVFYAALFAVAVTNFGTADGGLIGEQVRLFGQKKTLAYMSIGPSGWSTALVKGILCNWMVTLGTVLAFISRSTAGKTIAMWPPITIFFAHGYEHSIVNMYAIPAAMLLGAPISMSTWWFWNQIPVTVGNIIGGALLTGMALYITHRPAVSKIGGAGRATRDRQQATGSG